jgi:hypothetical protein
MELSAISVREKSGQDIVRQLSGRDAELVIDPTMYLTPEQWVEIEKKPKGLESNRFVLFYLLGNYSKDKIVSMKNHFEKQDKKVVFLQNEYSKLDIGTDEEFAYDPSNFIWLIRNSSMVITDSFHAVVFSLQFQKPFAIVKRDTLEEDISTRIKNLIDIFQIENAYCTNENSIIPAEVNYEKVKVVLEEQRIQFMNFIDQNI